MIKNNESKVDISNYNITYYKNKGYSCNIGDILSIDVSTMSKNSHNRVVAICEICKIEKEINFSKYNCNFDRGGFYSCKKCSSFKRKKTTIDKYGVEHVSQRVEYKEKAKIWMSSDEFKNKSTNTQIEKYGCRYTQTDESKEFLSINTKEIVKRKKEIGEYNCPLSSPENKELREKGMFDKYGHTYSFHVDEIKTKIQNKNLQKFGHISPFGNKDVVEMVKKTNLERYGVDNPFKSKYIQDKIQIYLQENYYNNILSDNKFKKYRNKIRYLTDKVKSKLYDEWDGYDYYDSEYIREYLSLHCNDNDKPTIDHKISCIYGYKNNIDIKVIADISNLCITKRIINSKKSHLNESEFILLINKN